MSQELSYRGERWREYPTDLFCIPCPCPETCRDMGISEDSITRVKRGLVDAPIEWYRSVSRFFHSLGFVKTWTDPRMWLWKPNGQLRGMISFHVDDSMFTGGTNPISVCVGFMGSREVCTVGVLIEEHADNSYHLSQPTYMEKVSEIPGSASRRKEYNSELTGREQTQLRAALAHLVGTPNRWHHTCQPRLDYSCPRLPKAASKQLWRRTNWSTLQSSAKTTRWSYSHTPFSTRRWVGTLCVVGCSRTKKKNGSSTQGLFLGMAPVTLLEGHMQKLLP